jgi:hypothetical protein
MRLASHSLRPRQQLLQMLLGLPRVTLGIAQVDELVREIDLTIAFRQFDPGR